MKARHLLIIPGLALAAGAAWLGLRPLAEEPAPAPVSDEQAMLSLQRILGQTRTLEANRDPKCHATASRLEDFIYGTPLSEEARFAKNQLQMDLVHGLWSTASTLAAAQGATVVEPAQLDEAADRHFLLQPLGGRDWRLQSQRTSLVVTRRDLEHYGSVAYALRAILAVQQEQLLGLRERLRPLSEEALAQLKLRLDLFTLAALQLADRQARRADVYLIDEDLMQASWQAVAEIPVPAAAGTPAASIGAPLLRQIVAQKIASYEAYNEISTTIFLRNLQVYFARHRWPTDAQQANRFKQIFTETMVAFAADLYRGAEARAEQAGHAVIRAADVAAWAQEFVPHRINEYEDVIFFPRLARDRQVTLEAYDLDSFRDSGLHWMYLRAAVEDDNLDATREPDPFAAEILVENIAQFGVLLLREAGHLSRASGHAQLRPEDIAPAVTSLQKRIEAHASAPQYSAQQQVIASSGGESPAELRFVDRSEAAGIDFMHRSADWLARLLRSYTKKSENVGNITIPPAFGGAGVAAEDIDNDGFEDILLLSGLGNRLYRNLGDGRFADITRQAGLEWRRAQDAQPGEPRQPIIADLDNDGWQDIVITYVQDDHRVYRNLGNGRFEDRTDGAGLGGSHLVGGPATVADFNNDGLLDLYIGYFGDYPNSVLPTLSRRNTNGLPNRLYLNQGGFRFRDATADSGLDNSGWTQAVGHTDFDGDGWQDIIIGNDFGVNAYMRNLGNGRFQDLSSQLGTDKPSYTMNIGLADLNDDLFPDVYISNIVTMNKDEKYVLPSAETEMKFDLHKLANMRVVEANDLFLSRSDGGDLAGYELSPLVGRGYNSTGWAWDADFFDLDNDGDDDLYVTNGMNEFNLYATENAYYVDPEGRHRDVYLPSPNADRNVLFVNAQGRLHNATEDSGLGLVANSRSAAYLDYDNDGDLDVILNNYHERAYLYENRHTGGHWLRLRLIGDPAQGSNRDAIGARIIAKTTGGKRIWREVSGTIGYLSVHPKEQHLGLGSATRVTLEVRWPNGQTQHFEQVAANRRYQLVQGGSLQPREAASDLVAQ